MVGRVRPGAVRSGRRPAAGSTSPKNTTSGWAGRTHRSGSTSPKPGIDLPRWPSSEHVLYEACAGPVDEALYGS